MDNEISIEISDNLDNPDNIWVNTNRSDSERLLDSDTDGEVDSDHGCNTWDPVFEEIKNNLSKVTSHSLSSLGQNSDTAVKISEHFTSISYGIQPKDTYEHEKKSTDIMGVTYNERMRQFIILDSKGITTWKRDAVNNRVARELVYPKYEYRLITYLVYARKYNCYFALGKDFSLKVLNRDFNETCSVSANLRSVLFMLFNPLRDELITGGIGGTKVWHFQHVTEKSFQELKPLANFRLSLKYELPNVGGSWVKRVDLDYNLEHLYCCSDTDLHVYDLQGKQLFHFQRAHTMSITGCRYSIAAKVLVTSSIDTEVKVWSLTGGLVHTFRGHSRAVTNLIIHPHTSSIVITCSLDGSVRMWSLDTMDVLYSLVVSASGLLWMGLTDDSVLYISTARSISLWNLNHFLHFWSLTRNQVTQLKLEGCPGKTKRVVAVGEDSSVRLFARSTQKNLSTVLPPPSISPLEKILCVCYSREFNVVFILINPLKIWVYTTRTDPACRMAVWDVHQIQEIYKSDALPHERSSTILTANKATPSYRATENGSGNQIASNCHCLCILNSSAMLWTDEGSCCPIRHSYLLLGLEDGRVLFMDPVIKGKKYMEFKVAKDPVIYLHHDVSHRMLGTVCREKQIAYVQLWSLPDLELQYEVFCRPDITAYAHIGYICVTAHENGFVIFHTMQIATDPGLHRAHVMPDADEVLNINHRPEHQAPVITVDACVPMKIFCSCSKDGAIKVWEELGILLTEIMLDESLSAACFLNNCADLIVAFKKHIFFIDHSKVCAHLTAEENDINAFDKESFVYEDLAVLYEGIFENPDPIDLNRYLVPYDIEFSKDFLEGRLNLEPVKVNLDESDTESQISMAPTDIYFSPPLTPSSMSVLDLTLGPEVSKYDLLQQMKSTLELLLNKWQRNQGLVDAKTSSQLQKTEENGQNTLENGEHGEVEDAKIEKEIKKVVPSFEFPRFGRSPGPTPPPSLPSTPDNLSLGDVSEMEGSEDEDVQKGLLPPKKIPDLQIIADSTQSVEPKKMAAVQEREEMAVPKRSRKAFADVTVDLKTLMKEQKPRSVTKKDADHSHIKGDITTNQDKDKVLREPVKKKAVSQRKLPKRGSKAQESEDIVQKEQLTHMQLLENKVKEEKKDETDPEFRDELTSKVKQTDSMLEKQDHIDVKRRDTESERIPVTNIRESFMREPSVKKSDSDTNNKLDVKVPSLPPLLDFHDPPLSSVSHRPTKATTKMQATNFFVDRRMTGVGTSPTAELESVSHVLSPLHLQPATDTGIQNGTQAQTLLPEENQNGAVFQLRRPASTEEDDNTSTSKEGPGVTTESAVVDADMKQGDTNQMSSGLGVIIGPSQLINVQGETALLTLHDTLYEDTVTLRTSAASHPSFQKELGLILELPSTADELKHAFHAALTHYKRSHGLSLDEDKLHNTGTHFDDKWHGRAIERHMLLRMKRELRAVAVQQRHEMLHHQKQQRPLSHQPRIERQGSILYQKPRPASTEPFMYMRSNYNQSQSTKLVGSRPRSSLAGRMEPPQRLQKVAQEKQQLGNERPFRLRMKEIPPQSKTPPSSRQSILDPWLLDPRNPSAFRPRSSKSIPNKCSRYILINRPRSEGIPMPTPLEEELMASRFPDQSVRLLQQGKFAQPIAVHHGSYGISYTPFMHTLYG